MKTSVSIVIAGVLATAGCHHQPATPAGVGAASKVISVSRARLVLPAVKGNPGAVYFTLGNDTGAPVTLVHVDIVGAQNTEMHETSGGTMQPLAVVRLDPGQRVVFAPAGKHVMAFGLTPALSPGGTSEITFHFQNGKTKSAPMRVEAAGGDMAGMAGMNMGGKP